MLVFAALLFFQSGNEFVAGGFVSSFLVREIGFSVREPRPGRSPATGPR